MSEIPSDRSYLSSHEWAMPTDDGLVVVGISEHAAQELGELVFIELPEKGDEVQYDSQFGEIESVKAVSELNSPVSGKVVEVNTALSDSQDAISESPFADGWMIKVAPADDSGLTKLLDASAYEAQLQES
ncbi:MAG: glycine cleavage system protein GcvH [Planctomycetota bacterium]|nr:glycine cleavage system protein GcvH [Planctomycetota bacterium]